MASDGMASITLGNDIVKPIIEAKISEAILDAMKGSEHLIREVAVKVLNLQVDSNGKTDGYSKDRTFLAYLCQKAIREAAETAVKEFVQTRGDEIKKAVEVEVATKKFKKDFATAMVAGALDAAKDMYRMNIDVNFNPSS